jgi:hypothetical protein
VEEMPAGVFRRIWGRFELKPVSRVELMPGVYLTLVKTDKFKTSFMGASMLRTLDAQDDSKNAVLPSILRRGSANHPDMQKMSAALDELYGARLEPVVRKKATCSAWASYRA